VAVCKIAIITSHPIQYYAPWFRYLVQETNIQLKVFFLWNFGITKQLDNGFKQVIQWDIPLLDGYDHAFVPNISADPGTHHFWGLQNPTLLQQVKLYEPDAVLLMCYNYASIYKFIWSWNTKQVPLLFRGDSHRLIFSRSFKEWLKKQWISQVFSRFAACLYVGAANYEYFRYHYVTENRLFLTPHAIDNDRFFAQAEVAHQQAQIWKQELGISTTDHVILFAGKFENKKRPLDLLKAFIRADLKQVSLLFVGSGVLEAELKAATAQYANVFIAPFQNQTFMPRTYAIADLVVLPSYGTGETWGLAINEAMCMARPIIVSNHVGCAQDLIEDGVNGLIFPAGDVQALTLALTKAFADYKSSSDKAQSRLAQWGKAGQEKIRQYSYAQTSAGLLKALLYLDALKK
jgi:glycosyltransferase involved in cell wall biosynthesis